MTTPAVPILERKSKAWPRSQDAQVIGYAPIGAALVSAYTSDAHFAAYSVPEFPYRLSSEAPAHFPEGVPIVLLALDRDAPDHRATPEWLATELPKIQALLAAHPGGYAYSTRGGYRVVYRLAQPFIIHGHQEARAWRAHYLGWCALLQRDFDLTFDPQCVDWTRLFRLPDVIRDGERQIPAALGDPTLSIGWAAAPLPISDALLAGDYDPTGPAIVSSAVPDEATRAGVVQALAARWPASGRHRACLALGGGLAQLGWPPDAIGEFVACVMAFGQGAIERLDYNSERLKQTKQAADAHERLARGELVEGWGALAAIVGTDLADATRGALWVPDPIIERAKRELGRPPPPPPGSFRELCAVAYADVVAAMAAAVAGQDELTPLFEPIRGVLRREYAATPWLVRGLVKRGGVLVVGGEPKTGKSWALTDVMVAVASGGKVFGEFAAGVPAADGSIEPGRVFYLYAEDVGADVQSHVLALCKGRGLDPDVLDGQAFVQPSGRFVDVTRPEDMALIVASVRWAGGADLVCLDPLRDIHSGEEDSSDSMRDVMRALRVIGTLLSEPGKPCTVATAHHTKKTDPGKDTGRGGNALRGSSAIWGALDGLISLKSPGGNGEDVITSHMEAVVRGARSAGFWDLTLTITDDERTQTAIEARWTGVKDTPQRREEERAAFDRGIEDRVLQRLRELREAGQPRHMSAVRNSAQGLGKKIEIDEAIERLLALPMSDPRRVEERTAMAYDPQMRPKPTKYLAIPAEEPK